MFRPQDQALRELETRRKHQMVRWVVRRWQPSQFLQLRLRRELKQSAESQPGGLFVENVIDFAHERRVILSAAGLTVVQWWVRASKL